MMTYKNQVWTLKVILLAAVVWHLIVFTRDWIFTENGMRGIGVPIIAEPVKESANYKYPDFEVKFDLSGYENESIWNYITKGITYIDDKNATEKNYLTKKSNYEKVKYEMRVFTNLNRVNFSETTSEKSEKKLTRWPWYLTPVKTTLSYNEQAELKDKTPNIPVQRELENGEMGNPVLLSPNLTQDDMRAVLEGWERSNCNQFVSDLISVRRQLPDIRDKRCQTPDRYLKNLPQTSIVICFYNEAWSVLLRTIHSILDRSPKHLIKEIFLVDDFSNMTHLKEPLENYMTNLSEKIHIIRAEKRLGPIKARLLGFKHVTADIVTFLDSHCECTPGWLEPLLDRVARNNMTLVFPNTAFIDSDSFQLNYDSGPVSIGGFDWFLQFTWISQPVSERLRHQDPTEPVWSPVLPGGLFTINCQFFEKLGTYDPDFNMWGSENLELSFKTWMCGGTIEEVPCSRVGHVLKHSLNAAQDGLSDLTKYNLVRIAEVWMDEFAHYYYRFIGYKKGDFGDVSSRKALRKNLQCKSFNWYINNVYPEFPLLNNTLMSGELRNVGFRDTCLDVSLVKDSKENLRCASSYPCHGFGGNQYWLYTNAGEIRKDATYCLEYSGYAHELTLQRCSGLFGKQQWNYNYLTKVLLHEQSRKCLGIDKFKDRIQMEFCDPAQSRQQWLFLEHSSGQNYSLHKQIE